MKSLIAFFTLICSCFVTADEYHYKNLLIGTKAIGLGGAFNAVSDDLSAVFYNPAGLSFAKDSSSASISTFAYEKTEFDNVFSTGKGLERSSFSVVPSFLGIGGNYDGLHWSLAFAVPDISAERTFTTASYQLTEQQITSDIIEYAKIDFDNTSYAIGFGASIQQTDALSLGISFIAKYNQIVTSQGSGINSVNSMVSSGFEATRRIVDTNILLTPTIGILYNNDLVNVGVKLSQQVSLSREFSASHTIVVNSPVALPPGVKTSSVGTIDGSEIQQYPTQISFGFAKQIGNYTVSFDIDNHLAVDVDEFSISSDHPPITRDYKATQNYALGVSYTNQEKSTFRLGVFTDKANIEIDTNQPFQRAEAINLIGISMSIDSKFWGYPVSFGGYIKYGKGNVRVADIRVVEQIVGIPLYPNNNNFDISTGHKQSIVTYVSASF
ncbi:MAG: hypothetical protein HWE10_14700 [Gammaproteobacteria bacterium]|nr:hypothetical protein [Gammaproteobacteria bacterium]